MWHSTHRAFLLKVVYKFLTTNNRTIIKDRLYYEDIKRRDRKTISQPLSIILKCA